MRSSGGRVPVGSNFAVTTHKGRIYACGGSVGVTTAALEVWDGAQWSVLSWFYAPSSAVVYDLAFVGDTLYAAGIFTNVDGVAVTNLARWDGSTWSGVGWNKGTPMALAVDGGNLYVGGTFTNVAGVAMKNVGQWDGSAWHTLGAGLGDTNSSCLYALAITNGTVYAGGRFTNSGSSVLSSNVARWDGSHWSPLGSGLDSEVLSLAIKGTGLYAGGSFGAPSATALAKWDGANWSLCHNGFGGGAQGIGVLGDQVCVAGNFAGMSGGVNVSMFAVWTGTAWAAAGSGLTGSGLRVCSTGTNVLVGGSFLLAGGLLANSLAAWDGVNWSVVGPPGRANGLSSAVTALATDGDQPVCRRAVPCGWPGFRHLYRPLRRNRLERPGERTQRLRCLHRQCHHRERQRRLRGRVVHCRRRSAGPEHRALGREDLERHGQSRRPCHFHYLPS